MNDLSILGPIFFKVNALNIKCLIFRYSKVHFYPKGENPLLGFSHVKLEFCLLVFRCIFLSFSKRKMVFIEIAFAID